MAEPAAMEEEPLVQALPPGPDDMEGVVEVTEGAADAKQATISDESLRGTFTWTLEGLSKQASNKVYSPNFEIGTHLWRLLVCPSGMKPTGDGFISVYLDSPEAAFAPAHLNPSASFKLTLINQLSPGTGDFYKESSHKWSSAETDWGFTQFLPLPDLNDPTRGFLVNDSLQIRVEIEVKRDERYYYDSRKETGFIGLKNQGATCYMNSLLQYLYHLPVFRKAVYHMPTDENDTPAKSLPLALQSLFYRLQYARTPASTKDLTASFGWSTMDAFMQHDVQELNRVLQDKLEDKMKGTRVEKVITELFEGHTYNFLECVHVEYKSSRRESFMDLQLDVKGCANIYESFDKYTAVEMMDGENQYKAEGHGLQDARKGVLFDDFPPVLQLQLKRFEYDFQRDAMVKINDRYEFFDELDLDRDGGRYLSPQADRNVRNLYRLHSVLVHSGGVHGGHYYAFIRPDGKAWYKFDDTSVTLETDARALEEQFGGDGSEPAAQLAPGEAGPLVEAVEAGLKRTGLKMARVSNAYMLVYVRVSDWPKVMVPVTKDSIQGYLRERLEAEQRTKERRQREKQEAHLYCQVRLATDADFAQQVGSTQWFDLADFERLDAARIFRVRKLTTFAEFKQQVAQALGVAEKDQRFWVWQRRHNGTYRPDKRLKVDEERATMVDLREHRELAAASSAKHALLDLRLYLELPWPPGSSTQPGSRNEVLLFFKHYDPTAERLAYVCHKYVPLKTKIEALHAPMRKWVGLPEGTPLLVYEEIKWEPTVMVDPLQGDSSPQAAELSNGDVLIFQAAPSPAAAAQQQAAQQQAAQQQRPALAGGDAMEVEQPGGQRQQQQQQPAQPGGGQEGLGGAAAAAAGGGGPRFPCVPEFLTYIHNRRMVTFKRLEEREEPGLQLELLRGDDYDTVTQALAARLGLDEPTKLRLTQHNAYSNAPQRNPIRYRAVPALEKMLVHQNHQVDVLYYEVLDIPLPQLEMLKSLKVQFHNDRTELVATHTIRVPKDGCVGDVLQELRSRLPPEFAGRQLRLLEVYHNKIYKVASPDAEVGPLNENYWDMRVEPVPEDELQLGEGDRIIHVYHITCPKQPASASQDGGGGAAAAAAGGGGGGDANDAAGGEAAAPGNGQQQGGFIGAGPASAPQVSTFGDPFLLRISASETLGQVKARIQEKLGVAQAEFDTWRLAFVSVRAPRFLADEREVLAGLFAAAEGASSVTAESAYLGLQHEDKGPKRPASSARHTYERAVKIYS